MITKRGRFIQIVKEDIAKELLARVEEVDFEVVEQRPFLGFFGHIQYCVTGKLKEKKNVSDELKRYIAVLMTQMLQQPFGTEWIYTIDETTSELRYFIHIEDYFEDFVTHDKQDALRVLVQTYIQRFAIDKKVNIVFGNYQKEEQRKFRKHVFGIGDKVRKTGKTEKLYGLTPKERAIVHTLLGKQKYLSTESFGEGKNRYLCVSKVPHKKTTGYVKKKKNSKGKESTKMSYGQSSSQKERVPKEKGSTKKKK